MHIDLSTRTAIVSGSTAGIGLAIAKGLAGAGAHVVVTGRTQARVDAALAAIRKELPQAKLGG
ncbi:MAG: SDR family NAD(P)-dependent oxidoreductase, partial [Rhodanobacter sp.]